MKAKNTICDENFEKNIAQENLIYMHKIKKHLLPQSCLVKYVHFYIIHTGKLIRIFQQCKNRNGNSEINLTDIWHFYLKLIYTVYIIVYLKTKNK